VPERCSVGVPYTWSVKVRALVRLLEQDGWFLVRTRGSHRQYRHDTRPGTVTVSGAAGADIPIGTLRSALKQAGLLDQKG
jgi:predicted RNA binding protein YcfA (HicA-like mRNA interferase family)